MLSHLYVHGDPLLGQKRCIALNAAAVTIRDSHIADCKAVGKDTQAIGGWNGPGPYMIENNYLEGAGENVLFGGADPAITNLVADGVTFRRNLSVAADGLAEPDDQHAVERGRQHRARWTAPWRRLCLSRHRPPAGRAGHDRSVVGLC